MTAHKYNEFDMLCYTGRSPKDVVSVWGPLKDGIIIACMGGNIKMCNFILGKWKISYSIAYQCVDWACIYNHLEIMRILIVKKIIACEYVMHTASKCKNMNMILLALEYGAKDYDDCMCMACCNDRMDVIQLMISLGAKNFNWGLCCACYNNHRNIMRLMIEHGATECI